MRTTLTLTSDQLVTAIWSFIDDCKLDVRNVSVTDKGVTAELFLRHDQLEEEIEDDDEDEDEEPRRKFKKKKRKW